MRNRNCAVLIGGEKKKRVEGLDRERDRREWKAEAEAEETQRGEASAMEGRRNWEGKRLDLAAVGARWKYV